MALYVYITIQKKKYICGKTEGHMSYNIKIIIYDPRVCNLYDKIMISYNTRWKYVMQDKNHHMSYCPLCHDKL